MPATSVICRPEMVMMWKMPASRIRSLASFDRKSRLPVTIAAAIAPSWPPMMVSTRTANRLRARSIAAKKRARHGASRGGGSTATAPSAEPTAPTPSK